MFPLASLARRPKNGDVKLMTDTISRRQAAKLALCCGALAPLLHLFANTASAADMPLLEPSDPQAKALGFVTDTSKLDAAAYPTYKPGQKCSSCVQYQGKQSDATAGCNIFAGHAVPASGWCSVWTQRPG